MLQVNPGGIDSWQKAVARQLETLTGTDRLDAAAIKGLPSGVDPLGLWDWWHDYRISTVTTTAGDMFLGAAVASGTNSQAIPAATLAGYNPYGVFIRSSTTANEGYRYMTSSLVSMYFGAAAWTFRAQFLWRTDFTGRMVRLGFHDTLDHNDATDGAYFEINGSTCRAKTANNGAGNRTENETTITLALNTPYTFQIDANAAGTAVRFRVWGGTSETPLMDVTNTANIPTTSARAFGAGFVATEASTTLSEIGILYYLGMGTAGGLARARG
jgi:hypothetical protein